MSIGNIYDIPGLITAALTLPFGLCELAQAELSTKQVWGWMNDHCSES